MASITLSSFRTISEIDSDTLSDERALMLINIASSMVSQITGIQTGLAIDPAALDVTNPQPILYTTLDGGNAYSDFNTVPGDAVIGVYQHGVDGQEVVLICGTGVAGLDGIRTVVAIDKNTLMVEGVSPPQGGVRQGVICKKAVSHVRVIDEFADVMPAPIAQVIDLRQRDVWSQGDPYPETGIVDPDAWRFYPEATELSNRIHVKLGKVALRRVPGRIRPALDRRTLDIQANYYAGFSTGVPADLFNAISVFVSQLATDLSGSLQSESFEGYSFQKASPEVLRSIPTSALAVLENYKVKP